MIVALAITPKVSVSAFGQTVQVGAVTPSLSLGISGPGEANLFGEGTLDTVQRFDGPIRPRIVWKQFNRNDDAAAFIQSSSVDGQPVVHTGASDVGTALANGWRTYFLRLIAVAGLAGAAIYLIAVGARVLLRGHRAKSRAHYARWLVGSLLVAMLVTAGFTALTVFSAARQLRQVSSLSDLVGPAKIAPVPTPVGAPRTGIDVVVMGDSTAAGIGNAALANPTVQDKACQRSKDAYAKSLQAASGLSVLNLACTSATIAQGLLGPQSAGGQTWPAQVGVLDSVASVRLVVVSIGADDVGWSDFMRYCFALPRCDDKASHSLFESRLDAFKVQYSQLLQQLAALPAQPAVLVNEYYNPFGTTFDCPQLQDPHAAAGSNSGYGFAADPGSKDQAIKTAQKIDPLEAELHEMNAVLKQGAQAFGFDVATPQFEGHQLCTDQSWVQGISDPAPFHPLAAGELAIAAADLPYVATLKTASG